MVWYFINWILPTLTSVATFFIYFFLQIMPIMISFMKIMIHVLDWVVWTWNKGSMEENWKEFWMISAHYIRTSGHSPLANYPNGTQSQRAHNDSVIKEELLGFTKLSLLHPHFIVPRDALWYCGLTIQCHNWLSITEKPLPQYTRIL